MNTDDFPDVALALIRARKTMVLATCRDGLPWSAPVYYVYVQPAFCFFSSPRSMHIRGTEKDARVAAAIFADNDRWEEIQGVQMTGSVSEIKSTIEQVSITARYLLKFPFAREFLAGGAKSIPDLKDKVRMYRFSPQEIHYVNNRMGFGQRVPISLPAAEQKEV